MAKKETLRQRLEREVKPISKEKRKEVVKRGIEAASPAAITKGVVAAKALRATKGVKRAKRISDVVKSKAKAATRGERKIRTDNLKRVSKAKALDKTVKANAEKAKAKVGTQTGMRASRTPDKISGSGMKADPASAPKSVQSRVASRVRGEAIGRKAAGKVKAAGRALKGAGKYALRGGAVVGGALLAGEAAKKINDYSVATGRGVAASANTKGGRNNRKNTAKPKAESTQTRGQKEEAARQRVMSEAKAKNTAPRTGSAATGRNARNKPAATSKPATTGGMTGKRAHNIVRMEKTKGGDYPVFKKGSAESKSFRKAYGEAKSGVFTWEGRKYKKP